MASSPSSYPFTPVVSSRSWKYDVFISFRGEDTRKTFVDHLYAALVQQGIYVYKDDGELIRGESIPPSLMKVIEESTIAVIIFSENYVNSTWCLNELAHIMKCKDTQGKMVLPIFYGVEPSVLRKQKWRYNEAFAKHELKEKTTVEDWRKALVDASQLSGYIVEYGYEAKVIKESVDKISEWLRSATSSVNNNLIGIEPRMQDLISKLQINSGGVRMIGIWGVGGGGKTILASCIYDEISKEFDGCSFVSDVREQSRKYGVVRLQEVIISSVTKKQRQVGGVEEGKHMLMVGLHHRKVLIVLDDVDDLDQLEALAGSVDWFGEGSRIIITTRDRHLLHAHSVDMTHEISLLNNDEAFALFRKHAWSSEPMEDYDQLSKELVSYASGLPLATVVIGSFLRDKNISEWKSTLAKLEQIGNTDIFEKLQISFDGLEAIEKALFLDIACFFRWENKDRAMEILDACGFHPQIGVRVLMQKSLITISDGKFDMHKLVQDMAHYIVRGEDPRRPEKRTRVWKKEDVQRLSTMDATEELDKVQAIRFKCNKADSLRGLPLIVANMKNLRWLDWEGDPPSPLPTNFPSRRLCYLKLDGILQKQLWEGNKYLPHLKIMELCGLRNLMTTPNFTEIPNLERFKLTGSWYLEEIHPSIGKLEKLLLLSIKDCFSFKMFPLITGLTNIQTVTFSRCPNLFKLPEIPEKKMEKVENLLSDTSGIRKEIEPRKKSSKNFFVIWLTCGSNNLPTDTEVKNPQAELTDVEEQILKKPCLPNSNMNWFRLPYKGLRELDLSYCDLGDEYMAYAVLELSDLRKLNISGNKFSRLDFSFFQLPQLKWLNISYCKRLVELSELPSSIAVLIADDCTSLHTFGDVPKCKWLWNVSHQRGNKLGNCYELILSMLQGNAVEDHFISVALELHNPEGFVGRLFSGTTFTLHLPDDWYNDFCGFLMCIVTDLKNPNVNIVVKKEEDKDSLFENWQESDEARDEAHKYDGTTTFVGYVSFNKLRDIVLLTSSFNTISFSIDREEKYQSSLVRESYVGVELIKRRSKGDQVQTTADCYFEDGNTFTIQHDSKSSINVLWKPCDHQESMIEIKRPNDRD